VLWVAGDAWWNISGSEITGGVIAGLIGVLIAWVIGRAIRWKRDWDDFGNLVGNYVVTEKGGLGRAVAEATITGHGATLAMEWRWDDGSVVAGRIVMNQQSRVTGSASYTHRRGSATGWGYLQLQVATPGRDVLLVDGVFTEPAARQQVASAWILEKRQEPLPT
jgi:hypothetical protein